MDQDPSFLDKFSPKIREAVTGLAFLGDLQKDVEFCGHTFVIHNLRPAEKMAAAVALQPWRGTLLEPIQWANAQVAIALDSVDGDSSFCPPIGPDINEFARTRLKVITDPQKGWYQPTLDFLFLALKELETEADTAIKEIQNLSKRSQTTSVSMPDSLTDLDTSQVDPDSQSQPLPSFRLN